MSELKPNFADVWIDYTNWRGERAWRRIRPANITFAETEWHPDPQWVMLARDVDKGQDRLFAMKDIHAWSSKAPV